MEQYKDHWETGTYDCIACGRQIFNSTDKFPSPTSEPSFRKAITGSIVSRPGSDGKKDRMEIICRKCGAKLGYAFDDGKLAGDTHEEAGMRYTISSAVLEFQNEVVEGENS